MSWAYMLLGIIAVAGLVVAKWKAPYPRWLGMLPLAWLVWELIASTQSVDEQLTKLTLKHFIACIVCFYLGQRSLHQRLWPFWLGLLTGLLLVLAIGLDQHFGGTEQSRRYFYGQLALYPELKELPPEFLKRIASNRIYSTLFYPNTLAGVVLLFLPPGLVAAFRLRQAFQAASHPRLALVLTSAGIAAICLLLYVMNSTIGWAMVLLIGLAALVPVPPWSATGLILAAGLACLYWSGSKGGWLLLLLLGLIASLFMPWKRQLKVILVAAVLALGIAGFFWKYSGFFRQGATSVSARFDYWRAALQITKQHPLFGTGPGTFAVPYYQIKRPESEMSRMVHNDYLEQASDSGLPGFLTYALFIVSGLACSFRAVKAATLVSKETDGATPRQFPDWLPLSVWLGVLGWALQSLIEFSLYIPALSWPAFAFLGWLLAKADSHRQPGGSPPSLRAR